jgi:outer membrane lipoprotein SlyB
MKRKREHPTDVDHVDTSQGGHPTDVDHVEGGHPTGVDHVDTSQGGHADTGTAAGVGGVTGAAIGGVAGPIGAVVGALGGMAVGAAAERMMHADDDARAEREHHQAHVASELNDEA